MEFEDELRSCIKVDLDGIDELIVDEIEKRFKDISVFIFEEDGEDYLQISPDVEDGSWNKVIKLKDISREEA